jgi:hypothetical protein
MSQIVTPETDMKLIDLFILSVGLGLVIATITAAPTRSHTIDLYCHDPVALQSIAVARENGDSDTEGALVESAICGYFSELFGKPAYGELIKRVPLDGTSYEIQVVEFPNGTTAVGLGKMVED